MRRGARKGLYLPLVWGVFVGELGGVCEEREDGGEEGEEGDDDVGLGEGEVGEVEVGEGEESPGEEEEGGEGEECQAGGEGWFFEVGRENEEGGDREGEGDLPAEVAADEEEHLGDEESLCE